MGVALPLRFAHMKLAVVVVAEDASGQVLLTRRTPDMRTFPRCWVFPGGSADDGEDLFAVGARELEEETGLRAPVESMRLLCLWESVYPTSCEECISVGQVKGHTIAAFVHAQIPPEELPRLRL